MPMTLKSGNIISQKITVNVEEDINTFLCTSCKRIIAASKSFVIDRSKYKDLNLICSNGTTYLKCGCGSFYEVIKCSTKEFEDGLKFRQSLILEE